MHKVADKFVYLCMIGAVPDARKQISFSFMCNNAFYPLVTILYFTPSVKVYGSMVKT